MASLVVLCNLPFGQSTKTACLGPAPGKAIAKEGTDLEEENRRLKQELLDVKMERDILKKACDLASHGRAFFKPQEMILAIFNRSKKHYGSPRIHNELRDMGIRCDKTRVERLMRDLGIRARHKRQFRVTTNSNHKYPVAPNLLNRQFQVKGPNQVWAAGITYIRTFEGWLHLAAVMDLFDESQFVPEHLHAIQSFIDNFKLKFSFKLRLYLCYIITA